MDRSGTLDEPYSLAENTHLAERNRMLSEDHFAPLSAYVADLRHRTGLHVPHFDPMDGGTNAEILFLLQKPGSKADGSGFISRNNPDPTARNTFELMEEAGIDRKHTILWNVIPAWNGTRKVTSQERRDGIGELRNLLSLLPNLRAIVLVGNNARKARKLVDGLGLPVFESAHPSPLVRNINPELYATIAAVWCEAASVALQGEP